MISKLKAESEMNPELRSLKRKTLIGKRIIMSFSENKTFQLWQSFMPRRNEIENTIGNELYSVEIYPDKYFDSFNPDRRFEKWAAMEVSDLKIIPEGMGSLTIPSGLYAVFIHKGTAAEGSKTYGYIFNTWIPISDYFIDTRPHFAVMGEKYKKDSAASEEEIWIPVKPKRDF